MSALFFNGRSSSFELRLVDLRDEAAVLVCGAATGFGALATPDRTFRDARRRETPAARDPAQAAPAVLARPAGSGP